jgi:NADH:ubiquinone oxidoreductase subunit 4 (subunit M)
MTIHLSIMLWLPAAAGALALFLPARLARWTWLLGTLLVLAYSVVLLFDYDRAAGGLQFVTDELWIPSLGIHYALAISGLNLVLLATTALAFTVAAAWYLWRAVDLAKAGGLPAPPRPAPAPAPQEPEAPQDASRAGARA